ncbi:MAG: hypothetical protein K6B70_02225 [Clostridia bacterium]|nr:hypothetical protein [Clostridia bacterium]
MYLEISSRQTGKTTRLINQIYADKHKYDLQILMGMNFRSLKKTKSEIKGNNKVKICLSFDSLIETIKSYDNSDKKVRVRLYVDEFLWSKAFCNNYKDIKARFEPEFNLISNGYFSSSMNSNETMILFDMQVDCNTGKIDEIFMVHKTTERPL